MDSDCFAVSTTARTSSLGSFMSAPDSAKPVLCLASKIKEIFETNVLLKVKFVSCSSHTTLRVVIVPQVCCPTKIIIEK